MKKDKKNKPRVVIDRSEITTSPHSVNYEDITPKNGVGISWEYFEEYVNRNLKEPQRKS